MSDRFKEALKWSSNHRERNKNKNKNLNTITNTITNTSIIPDVNKNEKPFSNAIINIIIVFVLFVIVCILGYVGYKYYFNNTNNDSLQTDDYIPPKDNILDPIADLKKQSLNDSFSFSL